jgi:hypothetical protein
VKKPFASGLRRERPSPSSETTCGWKNFFLARERHGLQGVASVGNGCDRVQVLRERDAFFESLDHFFMVQAVRG